MPQPTMFQLPRVLLDTASFCARDEPRPGAERPAPTRAVGEARAHPGLRAFGLGAILLTGCGERDPVLWDAATFTSAGETDAEAGGEGTEGEGFGGDAGGPTFPASLCGDGRVEGDEACDDGNGVDDDACTNACTPAACGDGIPSAWAGEACDDGNAIDDDGCDADCQPSRAVQVTAGRTHSCARTRAGGVFCWGDGALGALGYGSLEAVGDDEHPADVGPVPLGARAIDVSAGSAHSCAVLEDGRVRCWGTNLEGRLGTGSWLDYGDDEPASAAPALDFGVPAVEVAAGERHSCARLEDGQVRCWGDVSAGRLGGSASEDLGDDELGSSGQAVALGGPALELSVGAHSCARVQLEGGAALRCWGPNTRGQLGLGRVEPVGDDEPVDALGPVFFGVDAQVSGTAAGRLHSCARLGPVVRCWGDGQAVSLGHGAAEVIGDDEYPIVIPHVGVRNEAGEAAAEVAVGLEHSCLRLEDGRVRCWGEGARGQLGPWSPLVPRIDELAAERPAAFVGLPEGERAAEQLVVGDHHACVLTRAGGVRCWGANDLGQLGQGHTDDVGDDEWEFAAIADVRLF